MVLQAFGVGIEEEDEDGDIYGGNEGMSNYDMTLGDEPEDLHKFTKPSGWLHVLLLPTLATSKSVVSALSM